MIKDAVAELNNSRLRRHTSARQDFTFERLGIIAKQNNDKEDLKFRWRNRNEERKRILKTLKARGNITKAEEELLKEVDISNTQEFKKRTTKERERGRSRKRSRSRKRKKDDE